MYRVCQIKEKWEPDGADRDDLPAAEPAPAPPAACEAARAGAGDRQSAQDKAALSGNLSKPSVPAITQPAHQPRPQAAV